MRLALVVIVQAAHFLGFLSVSSISKRKAWDILCVKLMDVKVVGLEGDGPLGLPSARLLFST
jgi:hypothetical protein